MHELVLALAGSTENRGLDPNIVRPGWIALGVVVALAVALFFLSRSFVKQTRKARRPWEGETEADAAEKRRTIPSSTD